jgi:DHA1 family tetracycline resistance protein-like MFS transporter
LQVGLREARRVAEAVRGEEPEGPGLRLPVLFATALLNALTGTIMIPVIPKLAEALSGSADRAAIYVGLFSAAYAGAMLLFSPLQGMLSDRFGRRPVLLASVLGGAAQFLLMAVSPSLGWVFLARTVGGATSASTAALNAYIADVSEPDTLASNFGWMAAAFAMGLLLGPALGGFLGEIDVRLPFYVAAALGAANWLGVLLFLPESLPPSRRSRVRLGEANPLGALAFLAKRPALFAPTALLFVFYCAQQCMPSTGVLYTGERYGWPVSGMGSYYTGLAIGSVAVQALLVKWLVRRHGEAAAVLVGFVGMTLSFLVYGSSPLGALFVLGLPLYALSSLITPGLQTILSGRVEATEQGRLQGVNAALQSLAMLGGPLLYTSLFAMSVRYGHSKAALGTHLYVAGIIALIGAALAWRAARRAKSRA